ncbi:MAG: nicotinate (nicotinamide) nucleotide adenylyltransferase [Myxococcota bacterium]|nr:nicotinate (nicotinamide) nucleotide adenylyltransferase [Myxococcota bacterium]
MRVALLGGSFNPPHVGHLMAAHFVRATRPMDEVWLMPAHRHPFGKELVSFQHRVRMCQLLCDDAAGWLKVSEAEQDVPGEGRTVDTLEHLTARYPGVEFTLILGSDILKDLPKWKAFDRIQELSKVLVLYRAGYPANQTFGPPLAEVSSSEIRAAFERGHPPEALVPRAVLAYAQAHGLYPPRAD